MDKTRYNKKSTCSHSFRIACNKSAVSLLESREQRYIKAINNNVQMCRLGENVPCIELCLDVSLYLSQPLPCQHAGSESEAFWLWPLMAITATYGHYGHLWPLRPSCSQNRAGSYMPDPTFRIPFGSVLSKKPGSYCANRPGSDQIRMAWSGFGQTDVVRKQADVQESSGPVSGRTQPARYQFPTFILSSTDGPDYIVQN